MVLLRFPVSEKSVVTGGKRFGYSLQDLPTCPVPCPVPVRRASSGASWPLVLYLTYRILDVADLTVGRFLWHRRRGLRYVPALRHERLAALFIALLARSGHRPCHRPAPHLYGHPGHSGWYSDPAGPLLHQPEDHGQANQSINVDKYGLLISLRWVKELALHNPIIMVILVSAVVIGVLYWFFGTELGCGIRATGSNPRHEPRPGYQHQLQCGAGSGGSPTVWWPCPAHC